ncbi:triose-phosphate isomerase [Phaeocystidibacter marisrubri]|uniref:Triosephosphate isomerase n=1 Tax=Phaeocystidibacter marisrubri TaxID=1577780 RepID=A0A6L3ZKA7_9FLAO|nr:triose-phosphate isomerase [Phaeocystidibacter marisrubri]KAB2818133.1 triose-phosphate isomerase [Phaeocystidibacter marisrubri]GGH71777.1 triosephosphate isomerase [Phaeocystidibacter marisrubri]
MRARIVAGNWKMNTVPSEGVGLVVEILEKLDSKYTGDTRVILSPPFTHLIDVIDHVWEVPQISVAAQNCHHEDNGAYTGEISAGMISDLNIDAVILGHSERRQYFGEDDALLAKKVNAAIRNSLMPIFCVGEVLEDRKANKHNEVVTSQLTQGLFHLSSEEFKNVIIAYEPVWAIGTGETASPQQAQDMHKSIRAHVASKYGEDAANNVSILYGGSVKPNNASEIFSQPDVDGGLIGGASLNADDFVSIVHAMAPAKGGLHAV